MRKLRGGCLTLMILVGKPTAAQERAVQISATAQHEVRSTAGRDYRLFVSVPEGYSRTDSMRYPVLYVLDGNDAFPIATGAYRYLRLTSEVPDVIIVGIGYPVDFYRETLVPRWTDYSPSYDARADSTLAPVMAQFLPNEQRPRLHSGGGPAFLSALRDEIIPLIEDTYRANGDRGLWGHSLAASFGFYVLFTQPELFSRYALHSPAVWWNGGDVYGLESAYARSHTELKARLFVSVGADEGNPMVSGADSLAKVLKRRGYPGLLVTAHTFANESHMSSVPPALSRGLRVLYADRPR